MRWFFLLFAMTVNAGASVLMKVGSKWGVQHPLSKDPGLAERGAHFMNMPTVIAIVLYALNIVAYRKALDEFNLNLAYPAMVCGGLVLVTAAAWLIPMLSERLFWWQVLGMVLIAIGIWLLFQVPAGAASAMSPR